ncbi:hypothetical protein HMPREF1141_2606 [Clostridium sp. MSTE9]|nr:hypothetical protein HMPREF1141_2606 [Clostridium sp. MSTE9]
MAGFHHLSHIQTHRTHAAALPAGNTSVGGRHQSKSRDVEKVRKLLARYHKRGHPAKAVAHAAPAG